MTAALLTRKVARFCQLTGNQRRYLIVAWLLLPLTWIALRSRGFAGVRAWCVPTASRIDAPKASPALALPRLHEIGEAVNLAAAHSPFPATCLTRSLLLQWLLRRRGVACDLQIGACHTAGQFRAHAWLEYKGTPINDVADVARQFASFASLPPPLSSRSSAFWAK